ncbi:hypothetical protein JL722_12685 [Aureococcus anophagefferens]|nr:hypothetical protein JL722_12685 [Aureococcus anophagefferens]
MKRERAADAPAATAKQRRAAAAPAKQRRRRRARRAADAAAAPGAAPKRRLARGAGVVARALAAAPSRPAAAAWIDAATAREPARRWPRRALLRAALAALEEEDEDGGGALAAVATDALAASLLRRGASAEADASSLAASGPTPLAAGHELHFDADVASGALPMCSAVVLLEAPPSGGRTVVTDRDPSDAGDAGAVGFVAENAERGLLLFDGRLLHGVLPGRPSPRRRTSLMLSFWDRALARAAPGGRPAANMALPAADGGAAWARALGPASAARRRRPSRTRAARARAALGAR